MLQPSLPSASSPRARCSNLQGQKVEGRGEQRGQVNNPGLKRESDTWAPIPSTLSLPLSAEQRRRGYGARGTSSGGSGALGVSRGGWRGKPSSMSGRGPRRKCRGHTGDLVWDPASRQLGDYSPQSPSILHSHTTNSETPPKSISCKEVPFWSISAPFGTFQRVEHFVWLPFELFQRFLKHLNCYVCTRTLQL